MSNKHSLDYTNTETVLRRMHSEKNPSEVHGILCGLSCTEKAANPHLWMGLLLIDPDPGNLLLEEATHHIQELQHISLTQINDSTCDFHLLLPADNSDFDDKIMALGEWCQGFLLGLSAGGLSNLDALPDDSKEFLKDILEMTGISDSFEYSGNEEDESAFEQLVEYIRMGVLLINEELNPGIPDPENPNPANPNSGDHQVH